MTIASSMKRVLLGGFFFLMVVSVRPAFAAPTCSTFATDAGPAVNFAARDGITVRANGLQAKAPVLVTFTQRTRNVEIASGTSSDLGAFTADAKTTRLPSSVEAGHATIKVLQGRGSASCDINLVAAAPAKTGGLSQTTYIVWGSVIGLGAILLGIFQIRRWQSEKLEQEMDSIAWRGTKEDTGEMDAVSLGGIVDKLPDLNKDEETPDDAKVALLTGGHVDGPDEVASREDERPLLDAEDDDGHDPDLDEDGDHAAFMPEHEVDKPLEKPGPVKAEASDAVTKLQAEVRSWRSR